MKNYIPKLLDSFSETMGQSADASKIYRPYMQTIKQSAIFSIEDTSNILDIDLRDVDFTALSPPYNLTTIEYDYPTENVDNGREVAPKRVSLVFYDPDRDHIIVVPFWFSSSENAWVSGYAGACVPRNALLPENAAKWIHEKNTLGANTLGAKNIETYDDEVALLREIEKGNMVKMFPIHPLVEELVEGGDPEKRTEVRASMWSDVCDDVKITLGLMAMLTCSNIEIKKEEVDAALNKKRAKRNKPLLPPVNKIIIRHTKASRKAHAEATKKHASPRAHWRRGHRRTLPTGKHVWVRPCRIKSDDANLPNYEVL